MQTYTKEKRQHLRDMMRSGAGRASIVSEETVMRLLATCEALEVAAREGIADDEALFGRKPIAGACGGEWTFGDEA